MYSDDSWSHVEWINIIIDHTLTVLGKKRSTINGRRSSSCPWGILQCARQCSRCRRRRRGWRRGHIPLLIELDPLLKLLQALCRTAATASCTLMIAHVLVTTHYGRHLRYRWSLSGLPVDRVQVVVITFEALLALDQEICAPMSSRKGRSDSTGWYWESFTEAAAIRMRASGPAHVSIGDTSRKVAVAADVIWKEKRR